MGEKEKLFLVIAFKKITITIPLMVHKTPNGKKNLEKED